MMVVESLVEHVGDVNHCKLRLARKLRLEW